jgi:hypothetical protein
VTHIARAAAKHTIRKKTAIRDDGSLRAVEVLDTDDSSWYGFGTYPTSPIP